MKLKNRVKSHEDFQEVIHNNKKVCTKSYVIYFKNNEYGYARIGISTSKKLGNAVIRNKIRRQIRMMCMQNVDLNKSIDYCIIVRSNYLQQSFDDNKNELIKLVLKI